MHTNFKSKRPQSRRPSAKQVEGILERADPLVCEHCGSKAFVMAQRVVEVRASDLAAFDIPRFPSPNRADMWQCAACLKVPSKILEAYGKDEEGGD